MRKLIFIILFISFYNISSSQTHYGKPELDPTGIQKNYLKWLEYQRKNIILSSDFVALDAEAKEINKETFLNELTNGEYIPIKLNSSSSSIYYQLFKILPGTDTSIKASLTALAIEELVNYKMVGKPFPEFSFIDLNGNTITNESIKGKIVVIKCWFIHCAPCIKEFPSVNKLVAQYKNRKDIIFISLAEDNPQELRAFLSKKPLSYLVVPNMKKYMNETLNLEGFPTHFILDKKGKISKVLLDYEGLELALKKESIQ
ncbi:TlpA family protein disulfide reductase [Flavobacterium sp.]|uniref:TlpA family protein disulfide reductase n=1 Tax=Flavobacterium sp. TaxID=239 RepID=UPI003BC4FA38